MLFLITIIMSLLGALLGSCGQRSNITWGHDALYGIWNWEHSSGGFTGRQVITPQTAGYTKKILFTPQGVFQELRADTLWVSASYTIVKKETIFGPDRDVIRFPDSSGLMEKVIMKVDSDSLELSDPCYDCFGHLYVRVRRE